MEVDVYIPHCKTIVDLTFNRKGIKRVQIKIDGKLYKPPHTEFLMADVPYTVEVPAADPT